MATWKFVLLLSTCVFGMALTGRAEPTLVIATGEIPPAISEQLDKSFLTAVFQVIEKEMGVKFVFKFMPWKRCEQAVEDLEVWGAIPYVHTAERDQKFYFSDRLYGSASKFFGYSADRPGKVVFSTELSELKPYTIGGVRGYWYEQMFHAAGIELELVTN